MHKRSHKGDDETQNRGLNQEVACEGVRVWWCGGKESLKAVRGVQLSVAELLTPRLELPLKLAR